MNINLIQNIVEEDGIVFLTFGGLLSQALISGMTEALENEAKVSELNMSEANNLFTIFIELSQNMMNYAKTKNQKSEDIHSQGLIIVGRDKTFNYYIHSQNIIDQKDKDKMEPILEEIKSLSKDELKAIYRELRRSGRNTHGKGGGFGFYEIAKRCSNIDYDFTHINENQYLFHFQAKVKKNKEKIDEKLTY